MVAGVNTSASVFNSSSPFIVSSDETKTEPRTQATVLTPVTNNEAAATTANAFFPPASIAQLTSSNANILLTEQAQEKPVILENPNPPLDTSSLGSLALFDEILSTSLTQEDTQTSNNNANSDSTQNEEDSFDPLQTQTSTAERQPVSPPPSEFTAAIASYESITQSQAAPRSDYATSTVDISA